MNVLAAVAWRGTWRGTQNVIPEEEELLDMIEMEELQLQTV